MTLDRALVAPFVNAAVGRFIGAVPSAGPAAFGIIGPVHGAIVGLARYAVGIAGVDARIGIGGDAIVERPLFGARMARQQPRSRGPPHQHQRAHALLPRPAARTPRATACLQTWAVFSV